MKFLWLASEQSRLNESEILSVSSDVFTSKAWFETLQSRGFEQSITPCWLAVVTGSGSEFVLQLPLYRARAGGMESLANYYTAKFGPIEFTGSASKPEIWSTVARAFMEKSSVPEIRLQPLDSTEVWSTELRKALTQIGYVTATFTCFINWYVPCATLSFKDYWMRRPSPLRHSVERGRRRLTKAGDWTIKIHQSASETISHAAHSFVEVYNASWKQPEPNPRFIPALIETAAREGWLRLGILRLDGRPIAAQLWLVHAGKANIYKLAYVEGFERFSPGSVLTAAMMEHVLEVDRVHEVDYGMGDEPYKRDWMSHRRERVGLIAFNPRTVRGLSAAIRHFGGRWVRQLIQPRPGG